MRRQSALTTLPEALTWLRDVAGELSDVPTRLHVHAVQPSDLLGAPKMSTAFMRRLDGNAFQVRSAPRVVTCPALHPRRRYGEARCSMCDDSGEWLTSTDVYERPLAAALSALSRTRSRMRPHPRAVVGALLREGCDTRAATERIGAEMDDRRYLSALRALYDVFSYTAIAARAA